MYVMQSRSINSISIAFKKLAMLHRHHRQYSTLLAELLQKSISNISCPSRCRKTTFPIRPCTEYCVCSVMLQTSLESQIAQKPSYGVLYCTFGPTLQRKSRTGPPRPPGSNRKSAFSFPFSFPFSFSFSFSCSCSWTVQSRNASRLWCMRVAALFMHRANSAFR